MTLLFVDLLLSLPLIGVFAMFGLGIVVTYQASRVLNLAHGAMAMVPAYVAYEATKRGLPAPASPIVGIVSGALIGVATERLVLRPLRSQGSTVQTVGTVALLSLLISIAAKLEGTAALATPNPFPKGEFHVAQGVLTSSQLGLFAVAIITSAIFFAVFRFTDLGLAMRGAAQNRRAAALMGVNPNLTTSVAWLFAGATAGLGGVLLASATSLDPYNLPLSVLPAFVAALVGGLESLPGVLLGSVLVGVVMGIVPALVQLPLVGHLAGQTGSPQVFLAAVTFFVLARRGQALVAGDIRAEGR